MNKILEQDIETICSSKFIDWNKIDNHSFFYNRCNRANWFINCKIIYMEKHKQKRKYKNALISEKQENCNRYAWEWQ